MENERERRFLKTSHPCPAQVAVVADVGSLKTLPERELASGVSEIIKYGLIRDAPFFEWLEAEGVEAMLRRDEKALIKAVEDSCRNKAEVVALDEKEGGLRATLNLGHTFGHAVETKSGYGTWLHGEAVGIGMSMAAHMSHELGWIDEALKRRCIDLVKKAQVPAFLPLYSPMDVASFEAIMAVDKNVADGALRLILLKGDLGKCEEVREGGTKAIIKLMPRIDFSGLAAAAITDEDPSKGIKSYKRPKAEDRPVQNYFKPNDIDDVLTPFISVSNVKMSYIKMFSRYVFDKKKEN